MVLTVLLGFVLCNTCKLVAANAFLRNRALNDIEKVDADFVQKSLLAEIEGEFGSAATKGRLARLEAALHPMFLSLPKNEHGKLGHATTRYALHRLFVQRHGWYIKGLEPAGESWHTESSISILKDQATSYVQELFEQRLGEQGFGEHELAVLAATVEHLIMDEAHDRLHRAYELMEIDASDVTVPRHVAGDLLDSYIKFFILGEETGSTISSRRMEDVYPGWKETQNFVRGVLQQVEASQSDLNAANVTKQVLTKTVEEIGEQFGRFQNYECKAMKTQLLQLGDQGIGRVKLADFYGPALDSAAKGTASSWQFTESVDYLKQVGALDDSNPSNPSVIVPNYVASSSNCLASSSYYSVCCIDECEEMMSKVEHELAAPDASAAAILGLVSGFSTSTVDGPRTLSPNLVKRLHEIANTHEGMVPLHGRLFAQWMHHAFPRECSLPHTSAENPHTPDEWLSSSVRASKDEMRFHLETSTDADVNHEDHLDNGWSHEEELLVPRKPRTNSASGMLMRGLMLLSAIGAVCIRVWSATQQASTAFRGQGVKASNDKWEKADKFV